MPMTRTDFQILTFKKANVTPTARASILVAIANINIVLKLLAVGFWLLAIGCWLLN